MRERSTKHDRPRSRDPAGNDQELNRSGESLGEFIQRGVLIAVGVVLLLVDGFRTPLWTLVGATFTLGAIVTLGPIENLFRIEFNRLTTRIVGKEVFHNEQRSVNANTVIGQVFGNIVEPSDKEENDHWTIANDFSLRSDEPDWKSFSVRMDGYDSLTGYFNANDQVWVSVLTPGGLRSFEREKGFTPRWEASGSYSKVSYRAEKPGTYHFVVSNFDPGEHEDFFGDDSEEDLGVELRLRLRKSSSRSRKRETN